jgi:hypothetical protein
MIHKNIRKALIAEKENKEKLLIEQQLLKTRVMLIFESENKIKKFENLSEEKKFDLSRRLFLELKDMDQSGLLSEGLMDTLKSLFGNAFGAMAQSFIEPMVRKVLNTLGITGYISDFVVSLVTRNPMEFIRGLSDCKIMTKLITQSLVEGLVINLQNQFMSQGIGWNTIRNAIVDSLEDSKFSESMINSLSGPVCDTFNNIAGKAKDVIGKLAPTSPS